MRLLLVLCRLGPGGADLGGWDLAGGDRVAIGVSLGRDYFGDSTQAGISRDAQPGGERERGLADGRRFTSATRLVGEQSALAKISSWSRCGSGSS